MADRDALMEALSPLLEVVRGIDPADPRAAEKLEAALPLHSEKVRRVRTLVREGVSAGWLCDRENGGVRFSRVRKAGHGELSIDAVHMAGPGAAHTHPQGEIDLCFAVSEGARFDGRAEGWTVYAPMSWHVPTVEGGAMDILYFLPSGAIEFGPQPKDATAVGLQVVRP